MSENKKRFTEIDVERINIVEKNGSVKMVLSNSERVPDPIICGKTLKRQAHNSSGMIFFNEDGDECGGLVYGSDGAALLFDAYKSDQIIGIVYEKDKDGNTVQGVKIWDRPPLNTEVWEELEISQRTGAPSPKLKELMESGAFGVSRMFLGKNIQGEAQVVLRDSKGRDRIRLRVDTSDTPIMEFLDENGEVTYSLPPAMD